MAKDAETFRGLMGHSPGGVDLRSITKEGAPEVQAARMILYGLVTPSSATLRMLSARGGVELSRSRATSQPGVVSAAVNAPFLENRVRYQGPGYNGQEAPYRAEYNAGLIRDAASTLHEVPAREGLRGRERFWLALEERDGSRPEWRAWHLDCVGTDIGTTADADRSANPLIIGRAFFDTPEGTAIDVAQETVGNLAGALDLSVPGTAILGRLLLGGIQL